jgi:propanol-preferring alcohol dehydrogenase
VKAAVLRQPAPIAESPLLLEDVADPKAGPGEVVVRVRACGVCRSNLHMVQGEWMPASPAHLPIIPGHEVVGEVVALGAGVSTLSVGARVGVQPLWSTCGACEHCLTGAEQRCRQRQITGETRDGGFAELMVADARFAFLIPEVLSDTEAAPLLCPGVTAFSAVRKAAVAPGLQVGVIGIGGVGHVAIQLAALAGAEVTAITGSAGHGALAEEVGARHVRRPSRLGGDAVLEGTLDSTIVFAPSAEAAAEAVRVTKPGGRIVLGVPAPLEPLDVGDEKVVLTTVLGSRWDVGQVLELAAQGLIRIVHSDHPLGEVNEVLAQLEGGKVTARAVLVP